MTNKIEPENSTVAVETGGMLVVVWRRCYRQLAGRRSNLRRDEMPGVTTAVSCDPSHGTVASNNNGICHRVLRSVLPIK